MKALPIGSVVRGRDFKLLIIGYMMANVEDKVVTGYKAVKYPRGFAGMESLGILMLDEVQEVLFEGYRTDRETEFTEAIGVFAEESKELKGSDFDTFM